MWRSIGSGVKGKSVNWLKKFFRCPRYHSTVLGLLSALDAKKSSTACFVGIGSRELVVMDENVLELVMDGDVKGDMERPPPY